MSTRALLNIIREAVERGETEFQIAASGQHDLGGPLWNENGRILNFRIWNPGQRVGGMCLPGTRIMVEGSAPADAGWLNSGGEITIRGDAGDTAGHCAASGRIYIGGRAGARSGSLMKRDPQQEAPELWILGSTGSFSFEFMGGGTAVVCGHGCLDNGTALGERPGVGMVGGVVYFRGNPPQLPADVIEGELAESDIRFLEAGLPRFLKALDKQELQRELSSWKQWRKLTPAPRQPAPARDMRSFRLSHWVEGGLFNDILNDDFIVAPLAATGQDRLAIPAWGPPAACSDCRLCLKACPQAAIQRRAADTTPVYAARPQKCIGCGICAAVCPQSAWRMHPNRNGDSHGQGDLD